MKSRLEKNKNLRKKEKEVKKEKRKKKTKKVLVKILLIILLVIIYGFLIEPNILKVNEYKINSNEISDNFHGLKIVHFSDLHYGSTINKNNIDKVIKKINDLEPDVLVFTGDLIEEDYNLSKKDLKNLTKKLSGLNAKLGKYTILGNHDYYNEDYKNIMFDSNFNLLINGYDTIYYKDNNPILIYGLDNITYGNPEMVNMNTDETKNINFKIVLLHEGDYIKKIDDPSIDLILGGHSHNGQVNIIKPIYLPIHANTYYDSYYKRENANIYISNGIGTSMIPVRIGSMPSINLYRLNKTK